MALVSVAPPQAPESSSHFPLRLNTGRYRDQWHTMTRTGLSATLAKHRREPLVEVHPADAACFGLAEGALARVATAQGESVFRVTLTTAMREGDLFVPMHWTDIMSSGGRTGKLVPARVDPHSGQPGFAPEWRGFLVSRQPVEPGVAYWTRSKVEHGWLTELAGMGTVHVASLLPEGVQSEASDLTRGMRHIIVRGEEGALLAALYITRSGVLPRREWIAGQLAEGEGSRAEWLAGRPSKPAPNKGPIVCVCHDVGEQQVLAAIDHGAQDAAAVGACTKAGTNCGSCRPIISRLIARSRSHLKEAAQ
jgi:assimilatory nitrate reductase catalytic subunit